MKKRFLSILITLVLLSALFPASIALANFTVYVYTSNGKTLNMRDFPTMNGNVIANIPYGTALEADNDYVGTTWVHVFYGTLDGYCMSRYLVNSKPGAKPKPAQTTAPSQGSSLYDNFVACRYTAGVRPSSPGGYVHLRWAPDKSAKIRRDYYNEDRLLVIAQNNTWAQVYDEANAISGFMMRSFLHEMQ